MANEIMGSHDVVYISRSAAAFQYGQWHCCSKFPWSLAQDCNFEGLSEEHEHEALSDSLGVSDLTTMGVTGG